MGSLDQGRAAGEYLARERIYERNHGYKHEPKHEPKYDGPYKPALVAKLLLVCSTTKMILLIAKHYCLQ